MAFLISPQILLKRKVATKSSKQAIYTSPNIVPQVIFACTSLKSLW